MKIEVLQYQEYYRVENCRVLIGSELFFENGFEAAYSCNPFDAKTDWLQEEVTGRMARTLEGGTVDFKLAKPTFEFGSVNQRCFALSTLHPYNYFHFIIEGLANLNFLANHKKLINEDTILVTSHLHSSLYDAVRILTANRPLRMLQLNLMDTMNCGELLVAPTPAHAVERIDGRTPVFKYDASKLNSLRQVYKSLWDKGSDVKLMIRRNSGYRRLVNSEKLEAIAKEAGWLVVQPEELSFVEQVRLFSRASHIIGPTGAWLANLLFVRPTTKVRVLFPSIDKNPVPSLWQGLAGCFGFGVDDVYGNVHNYNVSQPIHSDFTLDEQVMLELVKKTN